jgi:ECF sigma factor
MSDVTRLLDAAAASDRRAAADLLPLVYDELRRLPETRRGGRGEGRESARDRDAAGEEVTGRRGIREIAIFRVFRPPPGVVTLPWA